MGKEGRFQRQGTRKEQADISRVKSEPTRGEGPLAPRALRVPDSLSRYVDGMWEWNVADAVAGRAVTGKLLPSIAPQFVLHYGSPSECDRLQSTAQCRQVATGIQTRLVTIRPTGPIHSIIVRLKPQAAPVFLGPFLSELRDAHVELRDLFLESEISELVERLAEAPGTSERVALVESFLTSRMCHNAPSGAMCEAALRLQREHTLSVRGLAAQLGLSERQLSRKFTASYGVGPKQFARQVRLTRALELRERGFDWLDVVSSCGFVDQAHLINDFNGLIHHSPERFFRTISGERVMEMNTSLSRAIFSSTFDP